MKSHDYSYVPSGTLPKPGWLGRGIRLFLGMIILLSAYSVVYNFEKLVYAREIPISIGLLVVSAVLFLSMPEVIDLGLTLHLGQKVQLSTLGLFIVCIAIDLIVYHRFWAPPIGFLFFIWFLLISIPLGLAFVLAAIWGTPGCEMRTYAAILARLEGQSGSEHYCAGGIDLVDRWEEVHLRKK